jgi:hypothetical protein
VKEFFNRKSISQFLNTYIGGQMKTDSLNIVVGKKVVQFLESQDPPVPLADVSKMEAPASVRLIR